jgi:transcription antitermination factor NusG
MVNDLILNMSSDKWYVFYLKSRYEKKVAEKLEKNQIPFYLPLVTIRKKWSDRHVLVSEPLIRGYIFVPAYIVDKGNMIYVEGIVNLLKFKGKNAIVYQKDIDILKDFLGEHTIEKYEVQSLDIGTQIEIRRGILSGKKGQVLEIKNKMAKIQLLELGIEIAVTVHVSDLKS